MAELDFDKIMDQFLGSSSSNTNSVKDVYNMIPTLSQKQIRSLVNAMYYIKKYDLVNSKVAIENFLHFQAQNKNLGFFKSQTAKSLLRAATIDELVKGVKPSVTHVEERES